MSPSALRPPTQARFVAPSPLPAIVAAVAGLAMVIGAWIGVGGEPSFARQVGYLNVAVGGIVVLVGGAGVYLVEYRRQIRRRIVLTTKVPS